MEQHFQIVAGGSIGGYPAVTHDDYAIANCLYFG